MTNKNNPQGASIYSPITKPKKFLLVNGETLKAGDVVYQSSAGLATATAGSILGIAAGNQTDGNTREVKATSESATSDYIMVFDDPNNEYTIQISTFTQTDSYTTSVSNACYDSAGSAGAQYINAAATSNDVWRIIGLADDDQTVGAYANVIAQLNPQKHYRAQNTYTP